MKIMEHKQLDEVNRHFDIDSGLVCLDFANTMDWHASETPTEGLNTYSDLVQFGWEAQLITTQEARDLLAQAKERPQEAERLIAEARDIREALYRLFADARHSEDWNPDDLALLTTFWQRAAQSRRITAAEGEIRWDWDFKTDDLGCVLWPVVDGAVRLLDSDQRERVGQCADDRGCGFLFYDTSRNRSRRWCSMEGCGNRAKAHRHYARARK